MTTLATADPDFVICLVGFAPLGILLGWALSRTHMAATDPETLAASDATGLGGCLLIPAVVLFAVGLVAVLLGLVG